MHSARFREMPLESIGNKDEGAARDARRQVVQMMEAAGMLLPGQVRSLVTLAEGLIHERQCMRHPRILTRVALQLRPNRGERVVDGLGHRTHSESCGESDQGRDQRVFDQVLS